MSSLPLGLLPGLLVLSACNASTASLARPSPSGPKPPGVSSRPGAPGTPAQVGGATFSPVPGGGIAKVELTATLAPDGSAQSPSTTFDHTRDRKIIAVLTLSGLGPGTKVRFDRYLNGNHADSKSATLTKKGRFFYFNFTARNGTTLAVGQYRLRFFVADHAVQEVSYLVR